MWSSHLEKIARVWRSLRGRLDPLQDFELWFWAGMTAGTHAVNAALAPARRSRRATMSFRCSLASIWLRRPTVRSAPRSTRSAMCSTLAARRSRRPVPEDVASMMHLMEIDRAVRDPCVRERRRAERGDRRGMRYGTAALSATVERSPEWGGHMEIDQHLAVAAAHRAFARRSAVRAGLRDEDRGRDARRHPLAECSAASVGRRPDQRVMFCTPTCSRSTSFVGCAWRTTRMMQRTVGDRRSSSGLSCAATGRAAQAAADRRSSCCRSFAQERRQAD